MAQYLKTRVINALKSTIATFVELPDGTPHSKGVRYFRADVGVDALWGAMDEGKLGRKYKKRIVVRPSRFRDGLFELYTYHFPKHWSAACVANREMIKEAQRQAHALEHSCTPEALEWRIRFFLHYFNVFKGHAKPEPGLKPYARFYQYTFVVIYRQLREEAQKARESSDISDTYIRHLTEEISFEPVYPHPFRVGYKRGLLRRPAGNALSHAPCTHPPLNLFPPGSVPIHTGSVPLPLFTFSHYL